jgi:hypothetical protein
MRIIGGRDYYDSATSFGVDKTVVYNRKSQFGKIEEFENNGFIFILHRIDISYSEFFYPILVFFAGKLYTGYRFDGYYSENSYTVWSYDELMSILNIKYPYYNIQNYKLKMIKDHFDLKITKSQLDYLIKNKITILTFDIENYHDGYMVTIENSNLKNHQFYKVLDPYTAFQEISMWVGGVLTNNPPKMVEITDERVILVKHGMDHTSFRKPKQVSK